MVDKRTEIKTRLFCRARVAIEAEPYALNMECRRPAARNPIRSYGICRCYCCCILLIASVTKKIFFDNSVQHDIPKEDWKAPIGAVPGFSTLTTVAWDFGTVQLFFLRFVLEVPIQQAHVVGADPADDFVSNSKCWSNSHVDLSQPTTRTVSPFNRATPKWSLRVGKRIDNCSQ